MKENRICGWHVFCCSYALLLFQSFIYACSLQYHWSSTLVGWCKSSFLLCEGWCFWFMSGSRQSTRLLWERRFFPPKGWAKPLLPLGRDGAVDCVRIWVCIIDSKLAFSEALQLADVLACGTWYFWLLELKGFNSTIVLGINTAMSGQGLRACGILMI